MPKIDSSRINRAPRAVFEFSFVSAYRPGEPLSLRLAYLSAGGMDPATEMLAGDETRQMIRDFLTVGKPDERPPVTPEEIAAAVFTVDGSVVALSEGLIALACQAAAMQSFDIAEEDRYTATELIRLSVAIPDAIDALFREVADLGEKKTAKAAAAAAVPPGEPSLDSLPDTSTPIPTSSETPQTSSGQSTSGSPEETV